MTFTHDKFTHGAFTPDEVAQKYFDEVFFTRVTSDRGAKKRARPEPLLAELEVRYGCAFPRDLRRLVDLRAAPRVAREARAGHLEGARIVWGGL